MNRKIFTSSLLAMAALSTAAFGHAGPRIYVDIENGQVVTHDGPYPPPEDSNGNVITDPAAYTDYSVSRVFPGTPPDETTTNGEPDSGILPSHWDDDPLNFSTEFPGIQAYPPGLLPTGTSFSYNIMGEVQWYDATNQKFEPISQAFPTQTPLIAVNNDLGQIAFSSTGVVPGNLAFTYSGDPTDHEHLTFTICTPEDLADGFSPEDAPAGIYALPLQFTSPGATPSATFYILFGDRGPNLTISQADMETEMQQAIGVANATLVSGSGGTGTTLSANMTVSASADSDLGDPSGAIHFDGGTLEITGTTYTSTTRPITWDSNGGGFNIADPANTFTVNSPLNGGGLTKSGPGTLVLTGGYVTSSPTLISGGTLQLTTTASSTAGISGTGNLTLASGASLVSDGITINALTIGGTVQIRTNGTATGTSKVSSLTLTGSLDLTNNALIVEATPLTKSTVISTLQSEVTAGVGGVSGIFSSTLPANEAIAIVDNSLLATPKSTFNGQSVDATSIIVTPALIGDTNIDGHVDLSDLNVVLNNLGSTLSSWAQGNFDGAATINLTDLNDVLNHLGTTLPTGGAVATAVPEPASLGIIALAAGLLTVKRRRRCSESPPTN
jgi:autotransporter-associated beta strand protein